MSPLTSILGLLLAGTVPAAAQAPVDTTVRISASSSLEFDPATIALKQGTRVKLIFENAGVLPHNIVFVKDAVDLDALASAASREGGAYVPMDMKDKFFGYTLLASPGQTLEVTFVVPSPGTYTYVCLVSGHAGVMLGTLKSLR